MEDVRDGSISKSIRNYVIPFVKFFDEVELGNALGLHKKVFELHFNA